MRFMVLNSVMARAMGMARMQERRKAEKTRNTDTWISETNCFFVKSSMVACQMSEGAGRKSGSIRFRSVAHHQSRKRKNREIRNGMFILCFFLIASSFV